jgi:alanine racemase
MEAKHALGEPRALISRSALLHNARLIRRAVGPAVRICAIVKANAYGHGVNVVCDTLLNFAQDGIEPPLVDAFAVASLDEAALIPESTLPVHVFRPVENVYVGQQREKLETAVRQGWILTVCSVSAAQDVARIALTTGRRAQVQVMLDTGMTRSGVSPEAFGELIARITAMPSLRLQSLCSHFACSEVADHSATREQFACFTRTTALLQTALRPLFFPPDGIGSKGMGGRSSGQSNGDGGRFLRHIANSGAVFLHPHTHLDMVRPGIALYGVDPTCSPCIDRPLKPVMKWTAPLLMIRDVPKDTPVGYGQTWRSTRDTRIGLVPVGYADGYLRAFSNRAVMLINGKPCPVVGRVSMDLVTLDLGPQSDAAIGDEVTIMDSDPLSPASVYALSKLGQTIPYELFCRIGSRIPRVACDPADELAELPRRATDAA